MKKLLIMGVNTRPLVNSALKLNFEVYSSSYYATYDFNKPYDEIHLLNQKVNESCGIFEEKYDPLELLDKSRDFLEKVDYIILCAGISSSDFVGDFKKYRGKILGNKNVGEVEDKYKFYKHICNKFLTPETFKIKDIHEVEEILKNNVDNSYILKPRKGSGGYGVNLLNYNTLNEFKCNERNSEKLEKITENQELILQENIKGINISSSVLSNNHETKTIINSRLLTINDYQKNKSFVYNGNIIPLNIKSLQSLNEYTIPNDEIGIDNLNEDMNQISQEIIKDLKLIGSNGVDMILSENTKNNNILENDIYIIEVNPRVQGTYECIEKLLKINLLDAHIKACQGKIIEIPEYNGYSFKKIIYSTNTIKIGNLNKDNVFDIPYPNVIIEKNQPLVTIIDQANNVKKLIKNSNAIESTINENIKNI